MYNVVESLQALSNYPISRTFVENVLAEQGIVAQDMADAEIRNSREYNVAKAKVYLYLASAPNISQNGVSYSLSSEDKKMYRNMAAEILSQYDVENCVEYGYQGDDY